MRIAITGARNYPPRHGGLEVAVAQLAEKLRARGHDVHLFVGQGTHGSEPAGSNPMNVHRSTAIKTKHLQTASQVAASIRAIRALAPDVISIHGVGPAFPLAASRRIYGAAATAVTCHGLDWQRDKWSPPARAAFKAIALRALRSASAVSSVSSTDASDLGRQLGRNVLHLPNGFPKPQAHKDKNSLDLPSKYTVAVGRLTPEKNFESLIHGYDEETAEKFGPLLIVGSGDASHSGGYERLIRADAPPWVKFLGALEHAAVLQVVSGAEMFLSASRLEGQPLTVLEAMAHETPLCLSDIPQHREAVQSHAVFFDPNSPTALPRAMALARSRSAALVAGGRALAESRTWEVVVASYEQWFQSICKST